ncbi:ATP-binding cassette domain-containing protein, partial [Alcaligenaceae bacterium 429]
MTPPYLLLDNVGYTLPDGRILFSDLNLSLDSARTGLVGRNGVGKSMLARIMAGELIPSHGRCQRLGSVRYLPQHIPINDSTTIASLLGIEDALTALQHIEAGSTDSLHFDVL